jgi:hypothetical protein
MTEALTNGGFQPRAPLSEPILLYSTREWDGTINTVGAVPNRGSHPDADMSVVLSPNEAVDELGVQDAQGGFRELMLYRDEDLDFTSFGQGYSDRGDRIPSSWDDLGGDPSGEPFTFLVANSIRPFAAYELRRPNPLAPRVYLGIQSAATGASLPAFTFEIDARSTMTWIALERSAAGTYRFYQRAQRSKFELTSLPDNTQLDNYTLYFITLDFRNAGASIGRYKPNILGALGGETILANAPGNLPPDISDVAGILADLPGPLWLQVFANGLHYPPSVDLGKSWPMVGFGLFRGEPTREDLATWYDYWFEEDHQDTYSPFTTRVPVGDPSFGAYTAGQGQRGPLDAPATNQVVIPAQDPPITKIQVVVYPASGWQYGIVNEDIDGVGVFEYVFEIDATEGDVFDFECGNRGTQRSDELGVGGLPDGGQAGFNSFSGLWGASGGGSSRIWKNGTLVAHIGAGGANGAPVVGADNQTFFQYNDDRGGGYPGRPGEVAQNGDDSQALIADPTQYAGKGGSQVAGGAPGDVVTIGLTGYVPATAGSGHVGGTGASYNWNVSARAGGPGGGGGYRGGGGSGKDGGSGGGSTWLASGVRVILMNYGGGIVSDCRNAYMIVLY